MSSKTRKSPPNRAKGLRKSAQVPDQYYGYSLQATRFLHLLLVSSLSSSISLEVFEDVGVSEQANAVLASQTKAGLVKNPISNHATDLWKTFSNWCEAAQSRVLDPKTTIFELYLSRKHSGEIARLFSNAKTLPAAADALEAARTKLWGPAPNYPLKDLLSKSIRGFVDTVLEPNNPICQDIVCNFALSFATESPIIDLRRVVAHKWVQPESVDDLIRHAHGWIKERIDTLLADRNPAVISVEEFDKELTTFLPRLDVRRVLLGFAGDLNPDDIEAERVRTYVDQLTLLDASDEEVFEAINAYLRASITRSKWGEQGVIHEHSFDDFTEALTTFWKNKRRQNNLAFQDRSEIDRGKMTLLDCCMHTETLQGSQVPVFFAPGCYHALADEMTVGWHPDYRSKLEELRRA